MSVVIPPSAIFATVILPSGTVKAGQFAAPTGPTRASHHLAHLRGEIPCCTAPSVARPLHLPNALVGALREVGAVRAPTGAGGGGA